MNQNRSPQPLNEVGIQWLVERGVDCRVDTIGQQQRCDGREAHDGALGAGDRAQRGQQAACIIAREVPVSTI
jgi:hypothetical protein